MKKFAHALEQILFSSRWLLSPLYLGLVAVLVLVLIRFGFEFVATIEHVFKNEQHTFILDVLALLDIVLLANLILIVIFAGYENFVSKIDAAHESEDRPHWMGTIDFSGLKLKLIGSLVAISVIELLKDFIGLGEGHKVDDSLIWRVIIHLVFVVSGVMFAIMDAVAARSEGKPVHGE
ncbi:MAG: TIGR00645 family protein [Rhodoluna sp.]